MTIPRIYHFVFGMRRQSAPFHLLHYLCLESCRQVCRPEAIRLYYHHEPYGSLWDRIRPHLTLERVPLDPLVDRFHYGSEKLDRWRYAHHSDFVRLERLLIHGGVYADMDTLFVRPMPDRLFEHRFVMGHEGVVSRPDGTIQPSLCNALLMAEPGAAFGRVWLEAMREAFDGSWSNHSTQLPHRLATTHPDLVHLEPRSSFFHFPPTVGGVAGLLEEKHPIPDAAYSLHLWEHLWWDAGRVDFSWFHHARVTPAYVAAGRTTVAVAAARFLPPSSQRPPWTEATGRLWHAVVSHAAVLVQRGRGLIGSWVYPWLAGRLPALRRRLRQARSLQLSREGRTVLRHRAMADEAALAEVLDRDAYGILDSRFAPTDVVLDIGGRIGAFSFACHALGSRRIRVFEPVAASADRLRRNLGHLDGITVHDRAICGSDAPDAAAPALPLDAVLADLPQVRLLKLDCQGLEHPMLLTATSLRKVERIVGNWRAAPEAQTAALRRHLEAQGFLVTLPQAGMNGYFDAVRQP